MIHSSNDIPASADGEDFPSVSDEDRKYLEQCEELTEELFEIANLFRVPLTNNTPWYEDGDKEKPVYHVGEYMTCIYNAFKRHGWTPEVPKDKW